MKIALVYDRVNKIGGAERILSVLHELWPDAPLYTSVYDREKATFAKSFSVRSSFIQHIPFAKNAHEFFPWLTPLAFESFDFHEFDAVISITSAEAKFIITPPSVCHICYCLTPTRYLWSGATEYERLGIPGMILRWMSPMLRRWDMIAATRPDYMVAISRVVRERIKKYYRRNVHAVIYPPVDTRYFSQYAEKPSHSPFESGSYLLSVGRLVRYKRFDLVMRSCQKHGIPLLIIGKGKEERFLRSIATSSTRFITETLTDEELRRYYHDCRGFAFGGREDFGIASVEAAASGKGVLCPRESGMAETVKEGVTGMTFDDASRATLDDAVKRFYHSHYDPNVCERESRKFDTLKFMKEFRTFVESAVLTYNR